MVYHNFLCLEGAARVLHDFHTHTFLSDGELSPIELIRRAVVNGYSVVALTDHAGPGSLPAMLEAVLAECALVEKHWNIRAIPGIELTHVPAKAIDESAREAKRLGAKIVVVHGETVVEPVENGTDRAAIESAYVDILAHPGLITLDEARRAAETGTFLEITSRKGHSLTNGHVVKMGRAAGARFLINSDSHAPGDLHTAGFVHAVGLGSGLEDDELQIVLESNPVLLMERLGL
ncbi:MAG: histidinol phosphate phosphatase domain-containing protein [Chloroflexota bacterium]|nr:MAG: histidinol phosphate phosphatase domain-containing protein [Chloroflexota bacterium]